MSYTGKKVIRVIVRIKNGINLIMIEYDNHNVEVITP